MREASSQVLTRGIMIKMGLRRNQSNKQANERGQVAILFALVFTFMFVLFAFVVDFGHLIQNKINLQIAADAAAYSGAAWQARLLNQMAAVNYHMRQDYKEMVMRLQVTHTRHNRNFPRGPQAISQPLSAQAQHKPFVCQQAHGFETVRGRRYANNTNLCRNADPDVGGLPPIVVPPVIATFDPFSIAIANQIKEIQRQADIECNQGKDDNRRLVQHIVQVFGDQSPQNPGIRPTFHTRQMKSLESFMNEAAQENPETSTHPMLETARKSALFNLTDSNQNGFKFELIQPQNSQFVEIKPIEAVNMATYFDYDSRGSACVAYPGLVFFKTLMGYQKNPEYLTYFGVKLTSKPKMLFMPQAWIDAEFPTLEAYAVAKPFGSRMGPGEQTDGLVPVPRGNQAQDPKPNFSVLPNDNIGFTDSAKLLAYFDSLHPYNDIGEPEGNRNLGWPEPSQGPQLRAPLQAIRTPNIFDALFYTVFPDPGENIQRDYLEPQLAEALYPDFLEAAGADNQLIQNRRISSTPAYLKNMPGERGQGGLIQVNADSPFTGPHYDLYAIERLGTHSVTGPLILPGMTDEEVARQFGFASPQMYHSAWAPPGESRIGYGVKFISVDTLNNFENSFSSGDSSQIQNKPNPGDPNLNEILH